MSVGDRQNYIGNLVASEVVAEMDEITTSKEVEEITF